MAAGGESSAAMRRRRAPNLVFWDLETSPLPSAVKEEDVLPIIKRRLSEWGYTGPVEMLAVGDYDSVPSRKLIDTGILIRHVLAGTRIMKMLFVLLPWVRSYPTPANLLIIAGDRRFPSCLRILQQEGYNVLERRCASRRLEKHPGYCWSLAEVDGRRPRD